MALSDSMFLVEIIVEELRSYVNCKEFIIKSQFADVFSITLQNYNERDNVVTRSFKNKRSKRKSKLWKNSRLQLFKTPPKPKVQTGQSIFFVKDVENLVSYMKKYPIELSLWSKLYPKYKLASASIPWSKTCINYISNVQSNVLEPVSTKGEYSVFDEYTSRRMAVIKLVIKLNYLEDKMAINTSSLYDRSSDLFTMGSGFDSIPSTMVNTIEKEADTNSKPPAAYNVIQRDSPNVSIDTGIIKTIYKGGLKKYKKPNRKKVKPFDEIEFERRERSTGQILESKRNIIKTTDNENKSNPVNSSITSFVKSKLDIKSKKQKDFIKAKSCSSVNQDQLNILNYIFGNNVGPFGNQVYCVNYFTVENDNADSPKSPKSANSARSSPEAIKSSPTSDKSSNPEANKSSKLGSGGTSVKPFDRQSYKFRLCDKECLNKNIDAGSCDLSLCSIDIPVSNDGDYTTITKCEKVTCEHKKFREPLPPLDDRILIDLSSLKKYCCDKKTENDMVEKLEEVEGEMKAKMKIGDDPCYCECECKFGFTKKTICCKVCGGYESVGNEVGERRQLVMPFPCPIYHKLTEKAWKAKTMSATGSDSKKVSKKADKKSIESERTEKESAKKGKKKKKENKFKFNYGYTAPKIGHARCALPCGGFSSCPVPKEMGWLWNSEDIPGMKYRPSWKPGAVSKHVVKLLKIAKNPEEAFAKKKRKKDTGKPKKPLKRPLIVVHKKDGEYTVTMETMKSYNKPRTVGQIPYEDKPLSTYKVGRTDEENMQRRKKKERAKRRLERDQRNFIQSAFRNMCEDICLKTYQQALGILPDAEIPDCPCYPAHPRADKTDLDVSCSCSDDSNLPESDTDSDEWMLEFTPPIAHFDQTYKTKKVAHTDNSSQYTYLDYRVKLVDRYGNAVPRFFKGPDGKEQCSDLGGFWSPEHKWLEINVDGYVAPDGKWAPNTFTGPNNENVDAELGKFQAMDGTWLVVGIDGYVDNHGKWQSYNKSKSPPKVRKHRAWTRHKKGAVDKKDENVDKKSETTWSCFGDASAKYLSDMGIMGHGHDRKLLLDTLNKLIAQGEDVKIPHLITVPRSTQKKGRTKHHSLADEKRCRHAKPTAKGIIAVDGYGNKTYFKLRDYKNKRPTERISTLTDQGISVSSFHMPCFHSFISSEVMKKQQYDRLVALAKRRGQSKGQTQGLHEADPYQHNRRYMDSYPHKGEDRNQYQNIIV